MNCKKKFQRWMWLQLSFVSAEHLLKWEWERKKLRETYVAKALLRILKQSSKSVAQVLFGGCKSAFAVEMWKMNAIAVEKMAGKWVVTHEREEWQKSLHCCTTNRKKTRSPFGSSVLCSHVLKFIKKTNSLSIFLVQKKMRIV